MWNLPCFMTHPFLFIFWLMFFQTIRAFGYFAAKGDERKAKLIWPFYCHNICTCYGIMFTPASLALNWHQDTLLVPLLFHELQNHYAFYMAYWCIVFYDFVSQKTKDADHDIMAIHHIGTFLALITSDTFGFRLIGLNILLLHDFSDIFIMSMKLAHKLEYPFWMQTVSYLACLVTWVYTRLLLFAVVLFGMHVLPCYYDFLTVVQGVTFTKIIYTFPVLALAILVICHICWTFMILAVPFRDDPTKHYEQT